MKKANFLLFIFFIYSAVLAKAQADAFVWARNMGGGGTSNSWGNGIALDALGNVYTTGTFSNTVDFMYTADFDPGPVVYNLTVNGYTDVFVHKMGPTLITGIEGNEKKYKIKIYPNPANDNLFIESEEKIISSKCVNYLGQIIDLKLENSYFNISKLTNGIYFLNLITIEGYDVTKKFVKN